MIIPLLHGVPSPTYPTKDWYPTPGNPQTKSDAKYNLDPLVWLIHWQEPLAPATPQTNNWPPGHTPVLAYAFSVDDGIGNILVNDADAFQVAVGGKDGLNNTYPYEAAKVNAKRVRK